MGLSMSQKILLTSFQTWLAHQTSNASDDLLIKLQNTTFYYLRQLPVDIARASERTIAAIEDIQPEIIICCGMAESRYRLTVESNATWTNDRLQTAVDLESLVTKLSDTGISDDAGKFVCEGLYYQVLKHLQHTHSPNQCVFVHVPVLSTANLPLIVEDFQLIIKQLAG